MPNSPDLLSLLLRRELRRQIGPSAWRALREGRAVLRVWRASSPYNWYIETLARRITLWHSHETRPRYTPPLELFELIEEGARFVDPSPVFRALTGRRKAPRMVPEYSVYRLL